MHAPAQAVGGGTRVEAAAHERGALAHPRDAAAVTWRRRHGGTLVVDVDEGLLVGEVDRHRGPGRARVARDVRERLLHDAEGRRLHLGTERPLRRAPQDAYVDARGADRVEE